MGREVWVDKNGEVVYVKGKRGESPMTYWEFQEAKDMKSGAVGIGGKKFYAPFRKREGADKMDRRTREKVAGELVRVAKDLMAYKMGWDYDIEDKDNLLIEQKTLDTLLKSLGKIKQKEVYNLYQKISYLYNNWTSLKMPFSGDPRSQEKLMRGLERLTNMAEKYESAFDKYVSAVEREREKINDAYLNVKYPPKKKAGDVSKSKVAKNLTAGSLFVVSDDVEIGFDPFSRDCWIGMGGEWWGGKVKEGVNVFRHKKESGDPGYQPVTVEIKLTNKGYRFRVSGGFGYETEVLLTFR
jgi:hypothetical protein